MIKYLEDSRDDVVGRINDAVELEDYGTATILKAWKTCLNTAISMIEEGKQNTVIEKLPEIKDNKNES